MKVSERIVNSIFRALFRLFFRLNLDALKEVPASGPYIIILNHPSIYEGPMIYVFLRPRRLIALAKKQLWERKFTSRLMKLWEAIPIDHLSIDRSSMQRCFEVLDSGNFLCLAPEGTRTNDPNLQKGKPGVAYIAFKKQVPIVPVVTIGFDRFSYYIKRLRKTPVEIIVGKPFEITLKEGRLSPKLRQELADEMMMRLAELMPKSYWGYYKDRPISFTYTRQIS